MKHRDETTRRAGFAPVAAAVRYDQMENELRERGSLAAEAAAARIASGAREHGIPLHVDPALIAALAGLAPGARIPRDVYTVVAECIAAVYRADADAGHDEEGGA